jgi:siderophore synthetase component
MSKYGISMEGHLQNSIIVLDKGEPSRLFIRDFGGVRILEERLRKQGMNISLYEGSAIRAKNGEDLWNKTFYPVFQNHFGELIACLVRYFDVSEEQLWKPVAAVCRRAFSLLKKDEVTQAYAKEDEAALFAPYMDLKAMTSMRLKGDVTDYTFAKVRNPLAEAEL